jgi:voltage-gated potassium channel
MEETPLKLKVKPVNFKVEYEKKLYEVLGNLRFPLMTVIFFTTLYVLIMMIINGKTDGESVVNYLFHTVITFTTVGYTEGYTDSITMNRLISAVFLMVAFPLVYFYGLAAAVQVILQGNLKENYRHWRMYSSMEKVKGHYIICGFNETSKEIIRSFKRRNIKYILIEPEETKKQEIVDFGVEFYVIAQPQHTEILLGVFIEDSQGLITSFDDDTIDITVIVTARLIMPDKENFYVFSTANSEADAEKMKLLGANEVIVPAATTGRRITSYVLHPPSPALTSFLDSLAYGEKNDIDIIEVKIAEGSDVAGKTLVTSGFKDKTGTNIIATVGKDGKINTIPDKDTILEANSSIIVLGTPKQLKTVQKYTS